MMSCSLKGLLRCPICGGVLDRDSAHAGLPDHGSFSAYRCSGCECSGPVVGSIPRFTTDTHYSSSFGHQWNRFEKVQIDSHSGLTHSSQRLFNESGWNREGLDGQLVLEVGSGAGRFTQVLLDETMAQVVSVDASNAVDANHRNNGHHGERLLLAQATIYKLPFSDNIFDKVLCLGVLQHTPDVNASVASLVGKAAPGGEIVVDFYQRRGWWTFVQAKYLLRPITTRLSPARLATLIECNIDWLIRVYRCFARLKVSPLSRFLPIVDIDATFPTGLTDDQLREWAVLDTFDMFSPQYDRPQKIQKVAQMFERHGAIVTFAGIRDVGHGATAAVVIGVKE